MDVTEVASDLVAEHTALDAVVANLTEEQWATQTASPGWDVADQIGHLAYFDESAAVAINDAEAFAQERDRLLATFGGEKGSTDEVTLGRYRAMSGTAVLSAWRAKRTLLSDAASTLTNDMRVPWYGPSMGSKSFLTARLMETWAHGQHVCDAIGVDRAPTDRIRHIAQLGVITRSWTYINRGLEAPAAAVHVILHSPSGDVWEWGPPDAASTITGSANDFCLVVTQCRNVADTNLRLAGHEAIEWLSMAQAFAGPATDGPGASPS